MMPAYSPVAALLDQAKAPTAFDQTFLLLVLARAGTQHHVQKLLERLHERNKISVRVP